MTNRVAYHVLRYSSLACQFSTWGNRWLKRVLHLSSKISCSLDLQRKSNISISALLLNKISRTGIKVYFESKNNEHSASFQKSLIRIKFIILKTSQQSHRCHWNNTVFAFYMSKLVIPKYPTLFWVWSRS